VKYLLLIYGNEQSRQIWDQMSAENRLTGLAAYDELTAELVNAGELIAAEALADPSTGRRVTVTEDQQAVVADGPYAEVKELVSGFYLIDRPGRAVRSVSSRSGSQDRRSSESANAAYSRSIENGTVLLAPPANEPPVRAPGCRRPRSCWYSTISFWGNKPLTPWPTSQSAISR